MQTLAGDLRAHRREKSVGPYEWGSAALVMDTIHTLQVRGMVSSITQCIYPARALYLGSEMHAGPDKILGAPDLPPVEPSNSLDV